MHFLYKPARPNGPEKIVAEVNRDFKTNKMGNIQFVILAFVILTGLCNAAVASSCGGELIPTRVSVKQTEEISYTDSEVTMCTGGVCGKLSLDAIKRAYPESFSSLADATERYEGLKYHTLVTKSLQETSKISWWWSDRDQCCPTYRYFTYYTWPINNVQGQRCYILQLQSLGYQYVSVGYCGRGMCCNCRQQNTVQSMLAWCPWQAVKIHYFHIPTYCSCQG